MIENLIYLTAFIIAMLTVMLSVYLVTRIAPAIAQINANAEVRKTRIEARADLAFDQNDFSEADTEESGSDLDALARMFGYSSVGSAISDPALLGKLTGKSSEAPVASEVK